MEPRTSLKTDYAYYMKKISMVKCRESLSQAVDKVRTTKESYVITNYGHEMAALISIEDYNILKEIKKYKDGGV